MSADTQLLLLCTDLGMVRVADNQTVYLRALLTQAADNLARRGVTLMPGREADDVLTASMAAWMYRVRSSTDAPTLPPYIQSQIRDRLVQQHTREDDA